MKLIHTVIKKFSQLMFVAIIIILSISLIVITKPTNGKPSNVMVLISGLAIPAIVIGYAAAVKSRMTLVIGISSLIFMIAYTVLTIIVLNFRLF